MGYEAATYTNELVATNPVGASDRESQGYLHIQNIKTALKNTFPNASSPLTATQAALNAYAGLTADVSELNKMSGVTATTAEINYLVGVTSPIQTQLDSKQTDWTFSNISGTVFAAKNYHYLGFSGGTPRLYLPGSTENPSPSPSVGDRIRVTGVTADVFVYCSPLLINGSTGSLTVLDRTAAVPGVTVELVYSGSVMGWVVLGDTAR